MKFYKFPLKERAHVSLITGVVMLIGLFGPLVLIGPSVLINLLNLVIQTYIHAVKTKNGQLY